MLYSKNTGGFYIHEVHGDTVPSDCVEISDDCYVTLMQGQSNGMAIVADENGLPILAEQIVKERSYAELRAAEYPPIANYLDGVVKGDQAQIDKYIADCLAVKAKYPKPEASL